MAGIYQGYERRKERTGRIDFEDMLLMAVQLFEEDATATQEVRERFQAFTVDEYQDVSPLQQALLERWLGDRDELCVVGDDYQTIYSFTGASPDYLLGFPQRYPDATVIRLEDNYRSSPQVLAVANGLARHLGGFDKELRATRAEGPNPTARALADASAEVAFVHGRSAAPARRRCGVRGDGGDLSAQRALGGVRGGARRGRRSRTRCGTARSCVDRDPVRCSGACDGRTPD